MYKIKLIQIVATREIKLTIKENLKFFAEITTIFLSNLIFNFQKREI
jgi:hypothetical protein